MSHAVKIFSLRCSRPGFSTYIFQDHLRHIILRSAIVLLALISVEGCRSNAPATTDLSAYFEGLDATFILIDGRNGSTHIHNLDRARWGFLPASTFKIPNTVIALDSGVADGADFYLEWDSTTAPRQTWWPDSWSRNHTLRTALPESVVWFYKEIARRVGSERYADYLSRFNYGNADVSGEVDEFWLSGDLRISAEEQVGFLERFFHGRIGASPASTAITKELMIIEDTPDSRLSGKTGLTSQGEGKPDIGWFVGYVEIDGTVSFFALNLDVYLAEHVALRTAIARRILRDMGLVDAP